MSIPQASFNFSANTVPTILTLGGILSILIHFLTPSNDFVNTVPLGIFGAIILVIGIFLFILVNR